MCLSPDEMRMHICVSCSLLLVLVGYADKAMMTMLLSSLHMYLPPGSDSGVAAASTLPKTCRSFQQSASIYYEIITNLGYHNSTCFSLTSSSIRTRASEFTPTRYWARIWSHHTVFVFVLKISSQPPCLESSIRS
jgi:hypothetical protein